MPCISLSTTTAFIKGWKIIVKKKLWVICTSIRYLCKTCIAATLPMTDVHDKATRSYNMSRIKGKDTKPEILVRKFLFSKGFRYRLHDKKLPGKPDIVLPKYKTVILIMAVSGTDMKVVSIT